MCNYEKINFATALSFAIMSWAKHLLSFYKNLQPPPSLPGRIKWLYPQQSSEVMEIVAQFCNKFYEDKNERTLLLGINPGRFGAGVTGVNFTAPKQLLHYCGIEHPFTNGTELSAEFIYDIIQAYGGTQTFYSRFFISSMCPLGFIQDGKNINYYDNKELLQAVEPFIVHNMNTLVSYHTHTERCICIGGGKNFSYLCGWNEKHKWFKTIDVLPHPRFIMQYKRKQRADFIQQYLEILKKK